jgi:hypothetical protein
MMLADPKRRLELWLPAALAAGSAILYLLLRPPMYDNDGYSNLLAALGSHPIEAADALHLLSAPISAGVVSLTGAHPYAPELPFQLLGIALCAISLFFFCLLLLRIGANPLVAAAATVFVAMSPQFWSVAFQNKPYPLLFAALVLFLWTWTTPDHDPPKGWRLAASGLFLGVAILVHQAAVFLAPVAAIALLLYGKEPWPRRIPRVLGWGIGTAVFVLAAYLWVWYVATRGRLTFLSWVLQDLQDGGGLKFRFAFSMAQAVMGIAGTVVNDAAARDWFTENLTRRQTLEIYATLGLMVLAVVGAAVWINWQRVIRTLRVNCLAGLCVLMILAWAWIVITYEPATPYHWAPASFPSIVLIVFALRARWVASIVFAGLVIPLSAVNLYLNHAADLDSSYNDPRLLAAAIDRNLGKNDIFIVLKNLDWYGDVGYENLFRYLHVAADQRGIAILNDFVLPANGLPAWRDAFRNRIASTLKCGGRVFVAEHVLDADSYDDLGNTQSPFAERQDPVERQYASLNGPALFRGVMSVLGQYQLGPSTLRLGAETFSVIEPIHGTCDRATQSLNGCERSITVPPLPGRSLQG